MLNSFATLPGVDTHHQLVISCPSTQLDYRRCTNTYHQSVTVPALDYCSFMADLITSMGFSNPRPPPHGFQSSYQIRCQSPNYVFLTLSGLLAIAGAGRTRCPRNEPDILGILLFSPSPLACIHDTGTALIFRVLRAPRLFDLYLIRSTLATA